MFIGELYASVYKTVALCFVYAPLFPLAYLLCAVSLLVQFACNKFCLVFWWRRPESVDDDLAHKLRRSFAYLLGLQFTVSMIGGSIAQPSQRADGMLLARVLIGASIWAAYILVPWGRLPQFAKYEGGQSTTEGIPYEQVGATKGYMIERYRCPVLPSHPSVSDLEKATKLVAPDPTAGAWLKLPPGTPTSAALPDGKAPQDSSTTDTPAREPVQVTKV